MTVYIPPSGGNGTKRRYHTDKDCSRIKKSVPKDMEHVERMGLEECAFCSGEVDRSWSGGHLAAKLRNGEYNEA